MNFSKLSIFNLSSKTTCEHIFEWDLAGNRNEWIWMELNFGYRRCFDECLFTQMVSHSLKLISSIVVVDGYVAMAMICYERMLMIML